MYMFAMIMLAGNYNEIIGETKVVDRILPIYRTWGECMGCVGSTFIPVIMAWLFENLNYNQRSMVTVLAEIFRTFVGASAMLSVGGILGVALLGMSQFDVFKRSILVVLCVAMIIYSVMEYISSILREIQKIMYY